MPVVARRPPSRADHDPALLRYHELTVAHPEVVVELLIATSARDQVEMYSVVRIGPRLYRGVVLNRTDMDWPIPLAVLEGTPNDIGRFLRLNGVPCLKLHPPQKLNAE